MTKEERIEELGIDIGYEVRKAVELDASMLCDPYARRLTDVVLSRLRAAGVTFGDAEHHEPDWMRLLHRFYALGYSQGHHDTVESQYVDVVVGELDTYHHESVVDLVADMKRCDDWPVIPVSRITAKDTPDAAPTPETVEFRASVKVGPDGHWHVYALSPGYPYGRSADLDVPVMVVCRLPIPKPTEVAATVEKGDE